MDDHKTAADVANTALEKLSNGTEKVFTTLIGGMENAAKLLKEQAPHVWGVLVRQQITEGIVNIICTIMYCIFAIYLSKWLINTYREKDGKICEDNCGAYIFAFILLALGLILIVTVGADGLLKILNPEYYAAKDIFDRFFPNVK